MTTTSHCCVPSTPALRRPQAGAGPTRVGSPARLLAVGALCVALAGCGTAAQSGTPAGEAGAGSAASQEGPVRAADQASAGVAAGAAADGAAQSQALTEVKSAPQAVPDDRKIARTATLTVEVANLSAAGQAVRAAATAVGGEVVTEQWDLRAGEAGQGALTLSVPTTSLDATMKRLEGLGTVQAREGSATDVTGTYVDTQGRLATMRASVARVRALMDRARTVREVIETERALATREAELEALERRMSALTGSVENATVTLTLLGPTSPAAQAHTGFWETLSDGFSRGVGALAASAIVALTALGILLPWVVPLALIGALAAWIVRRRRSRGRVGDDAGTAGGGTAGGGTDPAEHTAAAGEKVGATPPGS